MSGSLLVVVLASSTLPGAPAEEARFDCGAFCGAVLFQDAEVGLRVETHLEAPPEAVVGALTDWEGLGALLPRTKSHEVRSSSEDRAVIYREMDLPLFFDDPWMLLDVTVERKAEQTRIHLQRREGTAKRFSAVWTVEPAQSVASGRTGTRLLYTATLEPPFSPPRFLLTRMQRKNVEDMLATLKARVDAKSVRAPPRCGP